MCPLVINRTVARGWLSKQHCQDVGAVTDPCRTSVDAVAVVLVLLLERLLDDSFLDIYQQQLGLCVDTVAALCS